jgi:hypothetical protein
MIRAIESRKMRWAGNVAHVGEMENICKTFAVETIGKRPLGRRKRRRDNDITMDLRETGWKVVGRIHAAQDRDQWCALVNTVMNLRVP